MIDGEIVVPDADGRGLDFDALLQRIHPAASRVTRLAAETPSVFIAFDVLALGNDSWLGRPFRERRAELERIVRTPIAAGSRPDAATSVFITPASTDTAVAAEWFSTFEGAGLDGIVAKPLDDPYQPDKRALVKVKHQRTAECVLAGLPHPQGRQRRRLDAARPVRRRRAAEPRRRRRGILHHLPDAAARRADAAHGGRDGEPPVG